MQEKQADPIKTFRAQWAVMTFYERFEQVIALALSAIIAVIIVVSLLQLISIVFSLLIIDAFNPGLYAGIPEISVSPAPVPPRAHPGR